jgi:transposase
MFAAGKTCPEVAAACGVTLAGAKLWKRHWNQAGQTGLKAKPHLGPKPELDEADLRRLEHLLRLGAEHSGFDSDLWTCPRVAQLIEEEFRVEYHPAHVWKVLQKLGWSCQKPERQARERDPAAVEYWRKVKWPRIKKGGRAKSYHRLCG